MRTNYDPAIVVSKLGHPAEPYLPRSFPNNHRRRHGDIQGPHRGIQGNDKTRVGGPVDFAWHTGRLAAGQQDIAGGKAEIRVGKA